MSDKPFTTYVGSLTDEELMVLDGKCRAEIQPKCAAARARSEQVAAMPDVPPHIARFVADVVTEATQRGEVTLFRLDLHRCDYCGTSAGYAKPRGRQRYGKQLSISGVDLARRFVNVKGCANVGCCHECWTIAQPLVAKALESVRAAVPESISGHAPRFAKYDRRKCRSCGWTGHEGQMGRLACYIGYGTFPGKCPKCATESMMFDSKFDVVDGYEVVEIAPAKEPA